MYLAQVNVARFRWPLDDPRMRDFTERIATVNACAEASPGFIWRYVEDYDGSTFPPPWNDPLVFFNMSVWRDEASLRSFVLGQTHLELLQRRAEWTEPLIDPAQHAWPIPDDERPTVDQAVQRLQARRNAR